MVSRIMQCKGTTKGMLCIDELDEIPARPGSVTQYAGLLTVCYILREYSSLFDCQILA